MTAIRQDDFEALLVAELETLREGEKFLQRVYPRLLENPRACKFLLRKLTRVQRRIDSIHAVLNPYRAAKAAAAPLSSPGTSPAGKEFS